MKLCELNVVAYNIDQTVFDKVLSERRAWSVYAENNRNFDALVLNGRRDILDQELPDELCIAVLERLNGQLYLGKKYLSSLRLSENDKEISLVEAYKLFGGSAIEQAFERSVYEIDTGSEA